MFRKILVALPLAALVLSLTPLSALADVHKFKVDNVGGHQVDHLYLSSISSNKWGHDQLGPDEVLAPNHHITFHIDTVCEMDVRVVYHDGTVHVDKDIDTCKYNLSLKY